MAERNGISIFKSTSPARRKKILQQARRLIGKKVFLETFVFNYRGRLLSINGDSSLNVLILASDEKFRKIRIDLPLIIEIGKLSFEKRTPNGNQNFSSKCVRSTKRNSITVSSAASPETQRRIKRIVPKIKGKVVIVRTLLYNYVVNVIDTNDSFITVRQLVDYNPRFAIKFRISNKVILDITDFPKGT